MTRPVPVAIDADWMDQATCRHADPDVFFPVGVTDAAYEDAKAICADCPVRAECLDAALMLGARDGVWGGKDPGERHRMVRARQREARRARA